MTEVQNLAKERPIDIAFISMKSYDTEWATTNDPPISGADRLRRLFTELHQRGAYCRRGRLGQDRRAIAAILSAELYAPGKIRRTGAKEPTGPRGLPRREVHGRMTKRIEELGAMIGTIDSCKVTDNLWGERWSKLCVNGMHNGISAASGLSGNAMRQDERIRKSSSRLAARACGSARR